MDRSLKNELSNCIYELQSIVNQLYAVSGDISDSISGMNTRKFTNSLDRSADKYQRAINKLKRIR